jgi:hypothetical protein|nr:MAG TPA: hypothetical protein [Caudoviricetes sp.]
MFNTTVPLRIYENVKKYFEKHNMSYDVQEIIPDLLLLCMIGLRKWLLLCFIDSEGR